MTSLSTIFFSVISVAILDLFEGRYWLLFLRFITFLAIFVGTHVAVFLLGNQFSFHAVDASGRCGGRFVQFSLFAIFVGVFFVQARGVGTIWLLQNIFRALWVLEMFVQFLV